MRYVNTTLTRPGPQRGLVAKQDWNSKDLQVGGDNGLIIALEVVEKIIGNYRYLYILPL